MKHESTARYPAPATVVIRMFTDANFHTRKLEALGMSKYKILDHSLDGDEFYIKIERKVPLQMPGMKKGGAESTVVHEEFWNRADGRGRVIVHPQGMPLKMSCETAIEDEGDGAVVHYDWTVTAKIPLIGAKLEKFVIADMERRADDELQAGVDLLPDYRD